MFDDIDKIDWDNIDSAYNNSRVIPEYLQAIVYASAQEAVEMLFKLKNNIFHQDTIYPITLITTPFLIELIETTKVKCRAQLTKLLAEISRRTVEQIHYIETGVIVNDENKTFFDMFYQLFDVLIESRGIYVYLLSNKNPYLRMSASYLLTQLAFREEYKVEITELLKNCFERETDAMVKASLIFSLGKLILNNDSFLQVIDEHRNDNDFRIKYAATIVLIWKQLQVTNDIVAFLVEVALNYKLLENAFSTDADIYDSMYHPKSRSDNNQSVFFVPVIIEDNTHFPWKEYCGRYEVINHLVNISIDIYYFNKMKPAFLYHLSEARGLNIEQIVLPILGTIFSKDDTGKIQKINLEGLSEMQREFLRVIYDNYALWSDIFVGNTLNVFKNLGLPRKRKEWTLFLKIDLTTPISPEQAAEIVDRFITQKLSLPDLGYKLTLEDYRKIKKFSLAHIGNDNFIPLLHRFTELMELNLAYSDITGQGISQLPIFPKLKRLEITGINCVEGTAIYLSKLINLEYLNLSRTNFNDDWLDYIISLDKLNTVLLTKTNISENGKQRLKLFLPDCRIEI